MAGADEVISLSLEVTNTSLIDALKQLDVEGKKVKETSESFSKALEAMRDDLVALDAPVGRAKNELSEFQKALNWIHLEDNIFQSGVGKTVQAVEQVAAGTGKAGKSAFDASRSMLEFGRVIQDFTQGGFAGVLNNLEGLSRALGGGAGLAGIATAVGTLAYVAGPSIIEWFASLGEQAEGVKRTAEELEKLRGEMEKTQKEVDKLLSGPTSAEIAQGDETTWRKKFLGTIGSEELGGVRSGLLQGLDSGQVDDLRRQRDETRKALQIVNNAPQPNMVVAGQLSGQLADIEAKLKSAEDARTQMANEMTRDLMTGGRAAYEDVVNNLPAGPIRDRLAGGSTAAFQASQDAAKIAADERKNKQLSDAYQRKRQQETDELNRTGQANEDAWRADKERQEAADERERERLNLEGQRNEDAMRAQAARDAEKAAKEAPLNEAKGLLGRVADANGLSLTEQQLTEAAKNALDLADHGVSANDAVIGALNAVLADSVRTKQQLMQQAAQIRQFQMLFGNLHQQSESSARVW